MCTKYVKRNFYLKNITGLDNFSKSKCQFLLQIASLCILAHKYTKNVNNSKNIIILQNIKRMRSETFYASTSERTKYQFM